MASFIEDLWESVFTPGPTPTLLIATNATFAMLQALLLALIFATHSIHFVVLSVLSAGLWYSINWFAHELQLEKAKEQANLPSEETKALESDETTMSPDIVNDTSMSQSSGVQEDPRVISQKTTATTAYSIEDNNAGLTKRRASIADTPDYIGTDSEWEKVSESEDRADQ